MEPLVLAGITPALLLLTKMREQFGVQTFGHELSGIGSVVEPLRDFGPTTSVKRRPRLAGRTPGR